MHRPTQQLEYYAIRQALTKIAVRSFVRLFTEELAGNQWRCLEISWEEDLALD